MNKLKLTFCLVIFSLTISGCATIYNPATERNEMILIDSASEVEMGRDMDIQIRKEMKMYNDPAMNNRLETIGQKIAAYSDRKDIAYHFQVVDDNELNAFAVPGGYVYVNRGLMLAADDNELAGVVAHEIGHIAARHSVKQLQTVLGYQLVMSIVLGKDPGLINQALDVVFNLVNLGYSRKDELLADRLAVRYTRRASYSAYGIISFFRKMQKSNVGGQAMHFPFLSSHPPLEDRIARIEEEIRANP